MNEWYRACKKATSIIYKSIPESYRSRTFSGITGDIKALSPKKVLSLISRKKGLGTQYAYLYLTHGIDGGKGYQACATEALCSTLGQRKQEIIKDRILDVGCAVGVTAGILSMEHVTGFDLIPDLPQAAKIIDSFTGKTNNYIVADMTGEWPFESIFDTVICGLVCHHLKTQSDITSFFSNANHVLKPAGALVITLPSGSISKTANLKSIENALEKFGFKVNRKLSGLVLSNDSTHSLFWMFLIIAEKISGKTGSTFISTDFVFPLYRTPVTRKEKAVHAKETVKKTRTVKHKYFELIGINELEKKVSNKILIYSTVSKLQNTLNT